MSEITCTCDTGKCAVHFEGVYGEDGMSEDRCCPFCGAVGEKVKELLKDIAEDIEYSLNRGRLGSWAPEDPIIKEICERYGYGAVMDSAARQWGAKDEVGAHTTGPARLTLENRLKKIKAALKAAEVLSIGTGTGPSAAPTDVVQRWI